MTRPQPMRNRAFRWLLIAQIASEVGDQLSRVALTVAVLTQTGSTLLGAATFALSYVPDVLGALFLAPLADRWSRRRVMLACDLVRAALVGVIALLVTLDAAQLALAVLFVAGLANAPFSAARSAALPDVVGTGPVFARAMGLSRTVHQLNQVAGLLVAGALVTAIGAAQSLTLDAATYLISFCCVGFALRHWRHDPALEPGGEGRPRPIADLVTGVRVVCAAAVLWRPIVLTWVLTPLVVVPEALALPMSRDEPVFVGTALLAALPGGAGVGAVLLTRARVRLQGRLVFPLGVGCCAALIVSAAPAFGTPLRLLCWFVSGACQAFMLPLIGTVMQGAPAEHRAKTAGLAVAGGTTVLAFAVLGSGALAQATSPLTTIGVAATVSLLALLLALPGWPAREVGDVLAAGDEPERTRGRHRRTAVPLVPVPAVPAAAGRPATAQREVVATMSESSRP